MVIRILSIVILLPLLYTAAVRLVGQIIVPTDTSSLRETAHAPAAKASPRTLRLLAALDPLNSDYPYLLAEGLGASDPAGAGRLNRSAIDRAPLSPRYWIQNGWIKARGGNLSQAYRSFEQAIWLDPRDAAAYAQQGLFLFQSAPFVDPQKGAVYRMTAQQSLELAGRYDPTLLQNPAVAFVLASIHYEKGETDKARMILRKADDAPVTHLPFLVRKWALHFQLGDTKKPLAQWTMVFHGNKLSPGQLARLVTEMKRYSVPDFAYFTGQIHLQAGETELARDELASLVVLRPNVADYRLALGDVYERLGKRADALVQYEKAVELAPSNQYARSKMIEYYKRR